MPEMAHPGRRAVFAATAVMIMLLWGCGTAGAVKLPKEVSPTYIQHILDMQHPRVSIDLQGERASLGLLSLVEHGMLEILSQGKSCEGSFVRLAVTEQGRETIRRQGWTLSPDTVNIRVGSLQYVPGSQAITLYRLGDTVTFKATFEPNANAEFLEQWSPAWTWQVLAVPGIDLTLASAGTNLSVTMPIRYASDARAWRLGDSAPFIKSQYVAPRCSS